MDFIKMYDFLGGLKENNTKIWFDEHRDEYDKIRKEWLLTLKDVIQDISSFDKSIAHLEAKDCLFRINRDVRFSKDKSPYKTNMGAFISKGGKKSPFAGYYIHLEPKGSFLAAGIWMPQSKELKALRKEIDFHFEAFNKIIEEVEFKRTFGKLSGDALSLMPKGFEKDSPASTYLKLKSFIVSEDIEGMTLKENDFKKHVSETFKKAKPFNDFLNRSLE